MTEQQLAQYDGQESATESAAELWRNELQDRLARYKKRRGRRIEGAFTMRFPFPDDVVAEPVAAVEADATVSAAFATDFEEEVLVEVRDDACALGSLTEVQAAEAVEGVVLSEEPSGVGELVLELRLGIR